MAIRLIRKNIFLLLLATILSILLFRRRIQFAVTDIGYLARPLWDKENIKFDSIITHYYAEGMTMKDRCEAHGWTLPTASNNSDNTNAHTLARAPKVYDAIIFSVELDMLEIRIRELWDVVDHFIILESNVTFTGLAKEEVFKTHRERFQFAESKIIYKTLFIPVLDSESAWDREGRMRDGMTDLFIEIGMQEGDIFTSVDVDELPYRHTIELFKSCEGVPGSLHLQLKNYLYSYEFLTGATIWETSIHKYYREIRYIHSQSSKVLLTDAGWHCSFCFRTIADFQFKMAAYSHSDRIRYPYMTTPQWIQKTICEGGDLFGMFPEAYSFHELFKMIGKVPKSITAVGLPKFLLENREKYRFLLPGGCVREDAPASLV
ncbi:hypothetical protein BG004_008337 [Podila humilis]|nr:hypothetical protein BG004_008337 [Podila humilis]